VVLKPIKKISYVVNQVGSGNLEERVELKNRDELSALGNYINNMISGLKERNTLLIQNRVIEAQNRENKKYLDNIQEGLVLLDRDFKITGIYSNFFITLFLIDDPEEVLIQDIIYPNEDSTEFMEFLDMIKNSLHADMEMLMEVNPVNNKTVLLHDNSKIVIDAYFARIFDFDNNVENIMVIFKDRTKIVQAEADLEREKKRSQSELEIISSMLKSGTEDFKTLVKDLKSITIAVNELYKKYSSSDKNSILRDLHTVKGIANYLGFNQLADIIHNSETLIGEDEKESIWTSYLDLGEELKIMKDVYNKFQNFIETNVHITPMERFLKTLPYMVKETSEKLDKNVLFKIDNKIEELPYLTQLKGSIIHLIRNSIDHGIEDNFKRLERKKNDKGTIILKLYNRGNNYIIEISDDGNGLDFHQIQHSALKKGVTTQKDLSHKELTQILFKPSFSSKESVTDVSGRGFGLDAVKDSVERLKGSINIKNRDGKGTTFQLKIPKGE
jgi:signal transduction histidine kinase